MDRINFKTVAFANICVVNVEKSIPDIYILLEVIIPYQF
jgi:hypothetical protein